MFENCVRRIGIELEYNSFDKLSRSYSDNNLPNGIYTFAEIIKKNINKPVEINKWSQTNNNENWLIKPDSSCGLEVCSPPDQPKPALSQIAKVIKCLCENKSVHADNRCSLHVHVEIEDFTSNDICFLVQTWINFEHFFYFLTKKERWFNRYCKPLGYHYAFSDTKKITANRCLEILSDNKYFAINFYHYKKEKRKTIEFRIMGSDACMDVDDCLNWCKLILGFVENCKRSNFSSDFIEEIKYKNIEDAYEFFSFDSFYANEQSFIMWIISRLNDTMHAEVQLPALWKKVLDYSKPSLLILLDRLQGTIK